MYAKEIWKNPTKLQTKVNTIIVINSGRAEILGYDAYLPAIYIHLIYVSTFSFFAIVVIINLDETIIVDLLQIDIHHG